MHLEPCPLCIFQRVGVFAIGVVFALAALHDPRGLGPARLCGAASRSRRCATIGVAARHLYIQSLPPGSVPACGASLDFMLKVFPLTDVLVKVLTGSGECAKVTWRFLGPCDAGLGADRRRSRWAPGACGPTCGAGRRCCGSDAEHAGAHLRLDVASLGQSHRRRLPGADGRAARRRSASRSRTCASGRSTISGRGAAASGPVFCFAGHTDVVPPGTARGVAQRSVHARDPRRACCTAAARRT